mgnify:CR=1 FL=1
MELLAKGNTSHLFMDFAHAPSKVKATTAAVKAQFTGLKLITCLELHTFSSLDPSFLVNFHHTLKQADLPIVYYDPEALKIKNRPPISPNQIIEALGNPDLIVFSKLEDLKNFLLEKDYHASVLLMMSSGNYGGIDWDELKAHLSQY